MRKRPDIEMRGIDVLVRAQTWIPVEQFDGATIPYSNGFFDVAMFVDVLHHTDDPMSLLREAVRVAKAVLIKDHTLTGFGASVILRLMDRLANERHGVVLRNNYWTRRQWDEAFAALGVEIRVRRTALGLYPWPASWIFGRSLHFVARIDVV
jgi:SAM-dependent methyltransferase